MPPCATAHTTIHSFRHTERSDVWRCEPRSRPGTRRHDVAECRANPLSPINGPVEGQGPFRGASRRGVALAAILKEKAARLRADRHPRDANIFLWKAFEYENLRDWRRTESLLKQYEKIYGHRLELPDD